MGIKAGVEPLALWEALRTGASAPSTASMTGFYPTNTTLPPLPCLEARTQGHAAYHRAGPRAGSAHAACQYGIRRNDGGAQSRLEPRQPITHAAPARTVWPQG